MQVLGLNLGISILIITGAQVVLWNQLLRTLVHWLDLEC